VSEVENAKRRILVVDDEGIIAMDLQLKLRNLGYDVPAVAHSAEQAIEKIAESRPELVLMDINMGSGMDGIAASEHIREYFGVPVVFLTAYADDETLQRAKLTGPYGYIVKPFTENELRIAVELAIHTSQSAVVLRRHARQQSTIAEFSQHALREMQIGLLMEDAVAHITHTIEVEYCSVMESLSDGKTLLLRAGVGWHEGLVGRAIVKSDAAFPGGSTLLESTPASAQPTIIEDLPAENRFSISPLLQEHGIISGMSVVIPGSDGGPFGVLGAYSGTRRVFTPDEVNFLQAVANVISQAIQRRRAEEGLRQARADIAERERAEKERMELLRRAQEARQEAEAANRAKDEFLATLSHELRTPLNAILGWATMIRSGEVEPEDIQHGLQVIESSARAQNRLIEDLLDVSSIITGKLRLEVRPLELFSVIKGAVESVQPAAWAREIRLHVLDSDTILVSGDPSRLQQVIWNLLSNAIKFTPHGGCVDVSLKQEGSHAEIEVSDTGQGISSEFLPYAFDRFRQADGSRTRRHHGVGLGLAIVRHLVESHGGTVTVSSDGLDKGATFTVRLPLLIVPQISTKDEEKDAGKEGRKLVQGYANVEPTRNQDVDRRD
jgi:signal transduction histidine kinase/AmiR/NasT family two-component response regulator